MAKVDDKKKTVAKKINKPSTVYEEQDKITESPSGGTYSPTEPSEKRISKKGFSSNNGKKPKKDK